MRNGNLGAPLKGAMLMATADTDLNPSP